MRFKFLCLLDSEVSNSAMLLSLEISTSHRAALLVEITYRLERNEIGSLDKTEVSRVAMVIVIHKHPFILAQAFPAVRRLMYFRFAIVVIIVKFIRARNVFASSVLRASRTLVTYYK